MYIKDEWNVFLSIFFIVNCFVCVCIFLVQCFSGVEVKAHYAKSSELLEGDWRWLVWKGDARLKDKKSTQECSRTMHLFN